MRQSVPKFLALLAVVAAACGEPTGTQSGISPARGSKHVVTSAEGTITKIQGDGRLGTINTVITPSDPTVRVLNLSGAPIANEPVTFTASNSGLANEQTTATVNTNAQGYAGVRWTLGTAGGHTLVATVGTGGVSTTFNAIATSNGATPTMTKQQGDLAEQNLSVMAGQAVPINPAVHFVDAGGNLLPRITGTWAASGNGSTLLTGQTGAQATPTTNSAGVVTTPWTFSTTAGTQTMTFTPTAGFDQNGTRNVAATVFTRTSLGNGATLAALTGTGRTYTALPASGSVFGTKNPAVQVTTSGGAGVPNVPVYVTFGTGTDNCGDGLITGSYILTNAVGVAQLRVCNTLVSLGSRTVTFTAGALSTTITGTVNVGVAQNFLNVQGDAQTAVVATTPATDPTVQLRDVSNVPIPNAAVTITASGTGTVANGTSSGTSITVNTDANGRVAARWTRGTVAGTAQTLTFTSVSVPGVTSVFTTTTTAAAAAKIVRLQNEVLTISGNTTTKNPAVRVTDQYDNPIQTAVLATWTSSGPATATFLCGNLNTGACYGGQAVDRSEVVWTMAGASGTYTATVAVSGATSVSFTVVKP